MQRISYRESCGAPWKACYKIEAAAAGRAGIEGVSAPLSLGMRKQKPGLAQTGTPTAKDRWKNRPPRNHAELLDKPVR